MQALRKKYLLFWILLGSVCAFHPAFSANKKELKMADSLFAMAKYPESLSLYKKNFSEDEKNNQSLLLKLAFLAEKTNNYTDCLFYLSKLGPNQPFQAII
jgi:hypothetical protein